MNIYKWDIEEIVSPDFSTNIVSFDEEEDLPSSLGEKEPVDINRTLNIDLAAIMHYSQFVDKEIKPNDVIHFVS